MKIDDKEIDKLLEDFHGENIKVPQILDEKLNDMLEELKPRKSKKALKSVIASILILIISYTTIPHFKTFADNVFKYIFGDIGVENAVNNGYEKSPNQSIRIGEYNIDIENIYMDNLRISFDAVIKNMKDIPKDEYGQEINKYSLYINNKTLSGLSVDNGLFYKDDKILKSNVQLIGSGVDELLKESDDKLILELELVRHYNGEGVSKDESLGISKITLDIPKNIQRSKVVEINKLVSDSRLNLDIERLEISPTMMYLDTKGNIDGIYQTNGLYNFKIISDSGDIYKENMSLSAIRKEAGICRQTIVPSIYYDNSKTFKLKAEGVLINTKKDIQINLNDNYPKEIDYVDSKITIKDVFYENSKLTIEVIGNDKIAYAGNSLLDGEYGNETYFAGDKVYGFIFETPKKDIYNFNLGMIMKHELPIDIDIKRST